MASDPQHGTSTGPDEDAGRIPAAAAMSSPTGGALPAAPLAPLAKPPLTPPTAAEQPAPPEAHQQQAAVPPQGPAPVGVRPQTRAPLLIRASSSASQPHTVTTRISTTTTTTRLRQHQQPQSPAASQQRQQSRSPVASQQPPSTSAPENHYSPSAEPKRRVTTKLRKRRQPSIGALFARPLASPPATVPSHFSSVPEMELPERLRDGDESNDDREDPAVASTTVMQMPGHPISVNMSQSIFGIIAAASSRLDCNDRFDAGSSSSDESDDHGAGLADGGDPSLARSMIPDNGGHKKHAGRRLSDNKLLRSLPALPKLTRKRSSKHRRDPAPKLEPPSEHDEPSSTTTTTTTTTITTEPSGQAASASSPLASQKHSRSPFHFHLHRRHDSAGSGSGSAGGSSFNSRVIESSPSAESSDTVPPLPRMPASSSRIAPVMSRMVEARAEMSSRPSFDLERKSGDGFGKGAGDDDDDDDDEPGMGKLARRLMEIFEFDQPEDVIDEYPCWLLQNVLLQGFLYITTRHVCFYAYLPKKAETAKVGYLYKSGKHMSKYTRYWFSLKGDVITYSSHAANLYFPSGHIDLRYAIEAKITDADREGINFSVSTPNRTYYLRADSAPSAKEWVKSIQRVILRSHNDGDSVKISLPIENIMDIEVMPMVQFAETCKIRVIDNDETYAIDEYFFSFFNLGKEVINVLKILVEGSQNRSGDEDTLGDEPSKRTSVCGSRQSIASDRIRSTKIPEPVKATLAPLTAGPLSPRASGEASRASFDAFRHLGRRSMETSAAVAAVAAVADSAPRRSFSGTRRSLSANRIDYQSRKSDRYASTDSYVQSIEDRTSLSAILAASSSEEQTASQILRGSDLFRGPTVRSADAVGGSPPRDGGSRYSPISCSLPPHASTMGYLDHAGGGGDHWDRQAVTPTLRNITKLGSLPLQRAGAFANYLNQTSRRMSSLIAAESMGYVEKVSGMWKGGRKHYDEPAGLRPEDGRDEEESDEKINSSNERFRAHFALPDAEKLQATYYGYIVRVLPLYGKMYVSGSYFCFRSLLPGTRTKLVLPLRDMENVDKEKGFRFGYHGLVLVVRAHEELFFEFAGSTARDDCAVTLLQNLDKIRYLKESGLLREDEEEARRPDEEENAAMAERDALNETRCREFPDHELKLPVDTAGARDGPLILYDDPQSSFMGYKPSRPLRITCLTIGSRGDVQPYIALAKGLMADGHAVRIATHAEFRDWIEGHGIEFACVAGDPGKLMQLCIENGTFTWAFLREATSTFRGWLDELLDTAFEACKGSELLIESPSAMAGIHIAEALGIPYFRAFTMPWTRTRAYPHAFIMPSNKMGGAYNYMTYIMFDNIFWRTTSGQINKWRAATLHLPPTTLEKLRPNQVPFLYNFSPSVVAPPLDYSDWIRVTGYWFLDEGSEFRPPPDLVDFVARARRDGKKLVYVGFGSIIVSNPAEMTREVIEAVLKADVRCILSKGWSDRLGREKGAAAAATAADEPSMPPEIHVIKAAPHDWLFAQIDAAAHHGGSGTTGASLRAGIPTIIRPFFGDQYFFANRVEDTGVGIHLKKWGAMPFARALWKATHDERMIVKARVLGESIRKENGVQTAIQSIYRDMEYAKSLIKRKAAFSQHAAAAAAAEGHDALGVSAVDGEYDLSNPAIGIGLKGVAAGTGTGTGTDEEDEESWTFVGSDEPDPEVTTARLSDGLLSSNRNRFVGRMPELEIRS